MLSNLRNKIGRAKFPFRYTTEKSIATVVTNAISKHGKDLCIDIGCGNDPVVGCQTLDINDEFNPDFVGDIRELFAPGYMDNLDDSSSLLDIPESYFQVVVLHHVLEHIEWIYTDFFVRWVHSILVDGGMVSIATPNAEYAAKVYIANLEFIKGGKEVSYPAHEHQYCKEGILWHINKWFNFKVFSGCSPGDYHHSMFDSISLGYLFSEQNFGKIRIHDGETLRALAYKKDELINSQNIDSIVDGKLGR